MHIWWIGIFKTSSFLPYLMIFQSALEDAAVWNFEKSSNLEKMKKNLVQLALKPFFGWSRVRTGVPVIILCANLTAHLIGNFNWCTFKNRLWRKKGCKKREYYWQCNLWSKFPQIFYCNIPVLGKKVIFI